jgi:FKBP-type peptidyl-prolyl cis-trans isomerase
LRTIWILTAAASLAVTACGRSTSEANDEQAEPSSEIEAPKTQTESKTEYDKLAAENLAASKEFLAKNAARDNVTVTESGLQYIVLEEGPETGLTPVSTDRVVVHYVGTLKDGVEFDSSRARGAAATFKLNQVIPGWTEGVQLMSEGDRFRFFVPPELAYRHHGSGPVIGPNEALIFDVELIKVQNPESNLAASNAFLAKNAKKDGVKETASGLQYEVITEGPADGATPTAQNTVKVHYAGTLINGTEFDSSYARGEPIEFPLGGVIPGWIEGLQLMSAGDKYRLVIPPALAYGAKGAGPIGPNEALIFEVELIDVK